LATVADGYRRLKRIALAEQRVRNGEAPVVKIKPPVRVAEEITDQQLERHQQQYRREPFRWWR
jgi:hypothetical protein